MKRAINSFTLAAFLTAALFLGSCKKTDVNNSGNNTATEEELKTQSDDQARFSEETDAVADDANASLENSGISNVGGRQSNIAGKPMTPPLPISCDAVITIDTVSVPHTITINYTGQGCLGKRTRAGKVILSFAPDFRWGKAGASYTVTYQNLKITRNSDNKSMTFNGTKTITNVSGGQLRNLASRTEPIIHDISSSDMSVTFDNGTQRKWSIGKRRTFTYDNGIVASISGTGTSATGAAEWGSNRFGKDFVYTISQPLVIKQSCDFRLVSGEVKHTVGSFNSVVTFGLDSAGNPVTSCPSGDFYYKAVWTLANGQTYTVIAPY